MLQHYTSHYVTHITMDSRQPLCLLQVRIESKADPFHQGVDLFLGIVGTRTCPISVIIPYVAKLGAQAAMKLDSPVFVAMKLASTVF